MCHLSPYKDMMMSTNQLQTTKKTQKGCVWLQFNQDGTGFHVTQGDKVAWM